MPNSPPPGPAADPLQDPPAKSVEDPPAKSVEDPSAGTDSPAADQGQPPPVGKGDDKSALRIAYIGAGGLILAAIVGAVLTGVFGLFQGGHSTPSQGSPSPSISTSAPSSGLTLVISEKWNPPVNGHKIIDVFGTAPSLGANQAVLAFAGRSFKTLPYYSSLPASVNSNGTWQAEIKVPAALSTLEFWGSVATVPLADACFTEVCQAKFYAQERRLIAVHGPHAAYLSLIGPPVRGRAGP